MIRRVKDWLGIESVKVEMDLPETLEFGRDKLKGNLILHSLSDQKVEFIEVNFIEKYERGRKDDKRINDYLIGQWTYDEPIHLSAGEKKTIPFKLELEWLESDMDKWQKKNALTKRLVRLAKWSRRVRSNYRLEVELKVKGAKLHPFYKAEIDVVH